MSMGVGICDMGEGGRRSWYPALAKGVASSSKEVCTGRSNQFLNARYTLQIENMIDV